jgi:protein-arginine kinase
MHSLSVYKPCHKGLNAQIFIRIPGLKVIKQFTKLFLKSEDFHWSVYIMWQFLTNQMPEIWAVRNSLYPQTGHMIFIKTTGSKIIRNFSELKYQVFDWSKTGTKCTLTNKKLMSLEMKLRKKVLLLELRKKCYNFKAWFYFTYLKKRVFKCIVTYLKALII